MQGCTEQQVYKTHCDNQNRLPGCHEQLRRMYVRCFAPAVLNGSSFVSHLAFSRVQRPLTHITVCLLLPVFVRSAVHNLTSKEWCSCPFRRGACAGLPPEIKQGISGPSTNHSAPDRPSCLPSLPQNNSFVSTTRRTHEAHSATGRWAECAAEPFGR